MGLSHDDRFLYKGTSHFPSQNCTYFKENQTWTDSKICMFQMTSRRLGFYSNKAPSTRMAPEEISVIRSKALKRPWLRQQLALWLWVKLLVIVSWIIYTVYNSQEQIQRLQWCAQLRLVMVSVVYAPTLWTPKRRRRHDKWIFKKRQDSCTISCDQTWLDFIVYICICIYMYT